MLSFFNINNLKNILIVAAIIAAFIFYQDYKHQKAENQRQTENMHQMRKQDSFHVAFLTYTKKEIQEYLDYTRNDLKKYLEENNIKTRKVEQIITQKIIYKDTFNRSIDLQPVLDAIKAKKPIKKAVKDSTDCLIIKGYVAFENDTLSLDITDREFKNTTDVVAYWERRKWKLFGIIPLRLFGKKIVTVTTKNECGQTKTIIINSKNKKSNK